MHGITVRLSPHYLVMKYLLIFIKFLLLSTAVVPLIVIRDTIFPYILGKMVFFRGLIEIVLILFLIYLLLNYRQFPLNFRVIAKFFKNPLFVFTILFIFSLIISAIFAVNPYRAFWGNMDRGEGLFGMFHYFIFLIMGLFIFEKKDWLNYFKISLVVGFILIFYAFLQYFNLYNFPFVLSALGSRPTSFIGNAAFLAVHMIFLAMFAVTVFFNDSLPFNHDKPQPNCRKSSFNCLITKLLFEFWRYFSLLIVVLSVITIFLTGTRGVILGLGAGFVFLLLRLIFKRKGWLRRFSVYSLIFLVIFSGVFWTTRQRPIWQKIPGFDRLVKTAFFDVNDPSTQTRIITWRLSWNAFKERPLFGWGPDNYLVAYEKHYDPDYAIYGETWLDRAHNKIFDLLVMQGIFGLLAYLGIFVAAFYLLFKKHIAGKIFIVAGLIAYFVQNLFLFDQFNSDIVFFILLGFLISQSFDFRMLAPISKEDKSENKKFIFTTKKALFILSPLVVIAVIFLGYSVYAFNYVPFVQAKAFHKSFGSDEVNFVEKKLKEAMSPYNFAQYDLRGLGVDAFYMDSFFRSFNFMHRPQYRAIADLLIEGMDEITRREPFDVRTMIREVEMLNGVAKDYPFQDENETIPFFEKAEVLMRKAVKLAPNRQEVYYHLAFNLAGQKRYAESIETARYAISLNPKVVRAHYQLFLMLALAGRNEEALKELAVVEESTLNYEGLTAEDLNAVMLVYDNQGKTDKVAELLIKSLDGRISRHKFERRYYERALGYFADREDAGRFLMIAGYLATFDDLKGYMETFIDLAKNGDWSILNKL
ncbi:MAG: O-antigen ligase family protein [Patescibacteria group bacterium]